MRLWGVEQIRRVLNSMKMLIQHEPLQDAHCQHQ
jgi:hypothetical protein